MSDEPEFMYVIEAYRWGYVNWHHYVVGVHYDQMLAVNIAEKECVDRGGKYATVVYRCPCYTHRDINHRVLLSEKKEQVCYYPSLHNELELSTDHHKQFANNFGSIVFNEERTQRLSDKHADPFWIFKRLVDDYNTAEELEEKSGGSESG